VSYHWKIDKQADVWVSAIPEGLVSTNDFQKWWCGNANLCETAHLRFLKSFHIYSISLGVPTEWGQPLWPSLS